MERFRADGHLTNEALAALVRDDSLDELGAKIVAETADGVSFNARNMVETVNAYNEAAAAGTADQLEEPHPGTQTCSAAQSY